MSDLQSLDCDLASSVDSVDVDDLISDISWNGNDSKDSFTPVSLDEDDWAYRGEGGANLVVSLPTKRTVVRFSKSKYADKDHDSKVRSIAYYANHVVRPVLGEHFVRPLSIGTVTFDELQRVKTATMAVRPPKRCNKDIAGRIVILSEDCVHLTQELDVDTEGDTFCIEIKPNQGWLAIGDRDGRTLDLCHRCLKRLTRQLAGQGDNLSEYCPLDLFSGNLSRMKKAVLDMYAHPENRFKVFKNGELIYSTNGGHPKAVQAEFQSWFGENDERSAVNRLVSLICTALLATHGGAEVEVEPELLNSSPRNLDEVQPALTGTLTPCNGSREPLPKGCILEKLLELQKETDLNVDGAKRLCDRLLLNTKASIEELHQVLVWHSTEMSIKSCDEFPATPLDNVSTSSSLYDFKANSGPLLQPCLSFSSTEFGDIKRLQKYLLSMTAKDISLMLTFRRVRNTSAASNLTTVTMGGQSFRMMVSVIDLDPKPVSRIKTWIRRKEEMLKAYSNL